MKRVHYAHASLHTSSISALERLSMEYAQYIWRVPRVFLTLSGPVPSNSPVMSVPKSESPKAMAETPFDDAQADLILQSSDKVHFFVFKNILSLTSPVFADMFSIPSPISPNSHKEVQLVPLSEHSKALDITLRHIYPVPTPKGDKKGDSLRYASILAEFARKYQVVALDGYITGYLTDGIEHDPVGVYAIAVTYEYNSVGASAARSCLKLPFSGLQSPYLRCATGDHISELLRYHVACGEAASALASSDRSWFSSLVQNGIVLPHYTINKRTMLPDATACYHCAMPDFITQTSTSYGHNSSDEGTSEKKSGPRCAWHYLHRSALVLAHHPTAKAIRTEDFVLKGNNCSTCAKSMRGPMLELSVVLAREVTNTVKKVSLSPCTRCPLRMTAIYNGACSYLALAGRFPYPRLFPRLFTWDGAEPLTVTDTSTTN